MTKFQIILISILIAAFIFAALLFSGIIPWGGKRVGVEKVDLTMWGPFPQESVNNFLNSFQQENRNKFFITYVEKFPASYKDELLNSMAAGNPPDIWFMTQDMVIAYKDKVEKIPFEIFPEREFRDTFIDAGDVFLDKKENKVIAFPFFVDPLVLYWNKDLFSSFGIAKSPQSWDEFLVSVANLTKQDSAGNIIQSGTALGEFNNVKNAKEIILMMILQTGNPIVTSTDSGVYHLIWNSRVSTTLSPAESSLRFFDEFSNPKKTSYSWNRAMSNSLNMFVKGTLAMYFGYGTEFQDIREKNPHLNFDVSIVPQIKDAKLRATFSRIYALAISKTSAKKQGAFSLIEHLTQKNYNKKLADKLFISPARRDLFAEGSGDAVMSVFYKSSVMSRTWPEPDSKKVSEIFQYMVDSTVTGKAKIDEAVEDAGNKLEELYK
ncbi:MAG: extracellular solute-binding protein [Patescibacteria group bacterium]